MKVGRLAAKPEKSATMHESTSVVWDQTLDSLMLTENGKGYTVHYS